MSISILKTIATWRQCAVLLTIFFTGCGGASNEIDLNQPVRYTLAGKKYEVPLGYHHVAFLKRKNRWPNPKDEFTNAGAISITGLIPGIRPYEESRRAEFERLGFGNKIHILITPEASRYPMEEWLARMKSSNRLQLMPSDLEGLIHYWDNHTGTDKGKGADVYIKGNGYFMLTCPRLEAPSPACDVTKLNDDGLEIQYTFSRSHLMSWRDIDSDVDQRIEEFRVK